MKTNEEYIDWSVELFNNYDNVLKENGVIIYNISYSANRPELLWLVISNIINKTNFITVDCIAWKKRNRIPNPSSKNRLGRIVEFIFIFVRETELSTFKCNKKILKGINGKTHYEDIDNFITAKNNDESNDFNKATFSTQLVYKLLNIYAKKGNLVYDSFMGIGTTAKGCIEYRCNYIGSELSINQINHFKDWLKNNETKQRIFQ